MLPGTENPLFLAPLNLIGKFLCLSEKWGSAAEISGGWKEGEKRGLGRERPRSVLCEPERNGLIIRETDPDTKQPVVKVETDREL